MGPVFAEIANANAIEPCEILNSTYDIEEGLNCIVLDTSEDAISTTYKLTQAVHKTKIHHADIRVNIHKSDGSVTVSGEFYTKMPAKMVVEQIREEAVKAARHALALRLAHKHFNIDPYTMEKVYATDLVYMTPSNDQSHSKLTLCYKISLIAPEVMHHALVFVDARNLKTVEIIDLKYESDVAGKVTTYNYDV